MKPGSTVAFITSRIGSLDMAVTVPDVLVSSGNGRLVDIVENDNDTTTFQWHARDPSNYGIALQIGPYELAQREHASAYGNQIPLRFWHLPGNADGAESLLDEMQDQIRFWSAPVDPLK